MLLDKNKKKSAFTLIEMLVVIAIISFMALAVIRIDFSRLSERQELDIFTNKIVSKIENIRNNSLIGKGIGINTETPDEWRIIFSNTEPGSIVTDYRVGGIWTNDSENSFNTQSPYTSYELTCITLDGSIETPTTGDSTISFNGKDVKIEQGCTDEYKILEIETKLKEYSKTIRINTLSGLINID